MARTRRSPYARRVSPDRWLVSYADFITLLFAFFAMMYTVSRVDANRLATVSQGLRVAFDGKTPQATGAAGVLPDSGSRVKAGADDDRKADIQAEVMRDLASELANRRLDLIIDRRGVVLSIPEAGTFPTGNDELSEGARRLVGEIARTVAQFPNAVRVEGHADNLPIRNARFRSNWDLSASRASRVVELLIERGIEPARLSATGYAEFHPRVPNITETARASNRRVDLVILTAAASAAEQPSDGAR